MEDGEIGDNGESSAYDPSFEWPAAGEPSTAPIDEIQSYGARASQSTPSWGTFRLLVIRTSILPRRHKLAILDGHTELQFGRDVAPTGTDTPRIRLKEMPVSKLHAIAYWEAERREWGVVDMGSKHGTFIRSATSSGDDPSNEVRLSPPRMASVPRRLRHLDLLIIGSTTFLVHIHGDGVPCVECSSGGGDEIPLFPPSKSAEGLKRTRDVAAGMDRDAMGERDPKKALTMLKRSLLTRHSEPIRPSRESSVSYVDRSARRRALHPDPSGMPAHSVVSAPGVSSAEYPPADTSQPPAPLLASNIGHRLLLKQGWQPGTALGIGVGGERVGLVEPLVISSTTDRQGVGMTRPASVDWKEHGKQKRWERVR